MIYLDHNASIPPSAAHLKSLFDLLVRESPGNPSSPHALGRTASVLVTQARKNLARVLDVAVSDIIFTSGGTEANNLGTRAIVEHKLGLLEIYSQNQKLDSSQKLSIITSAFEHPSVLKPLEQIAQQFPNHLELILIHPNSDGYISAQDVISHIKENTILIAIMAANNEIGTIQPVKEIGDFLHAKRKESDNFYRYIHFHVDAVQIFGKIPTQDWMSLGYDSIALSGHKVGSLQGVGALVLKKGRKFQPLNQGGAQEKNRRAGTENVPGIVSFGIVCEEMMHPQYWDKVNAMQKLTWMLFDALAKNQSVVLNSRKEHAVPNTVHFSFINSTRRAEDLILTLDLQGICVSSGAACSSGVNLPSHVLLAMGKSKDVAANSVRISLGFEITESDIDKVMHVLET